MKRLAKYLPAALTAIVLTAGSLLIGLVTEEMAPRDPATSPLGGYYRPVIIVAAVVVVLILTPLALRWRERRITN